MTESSSSSTTPQVVGDHLGPQGVAQPGGTVGSRTAALVTIVLAVVVMIGLGACSGDDGTDSASSTVSTEASGERQGPEAVETLETVEVTATPAPPTATPEPTTTPWPTPTPLPTVAPPTATPAPTPQPDRTEPAVRPPGDWDVEVLTAKNGTSFVPVYDDDGNEFALKYTYLNGNKVDYPLLNPTFYNNSLSLMVVEGTRGDDRVKVSLPVRPQGTTGWVDTDLFNWSESDFFVEINVSTNTVRAWDGPDLITETTAVTGSANRPTPLLEGYIDEKVPGPNGAYGPWVLTLATFSESVNTFGANNGLPKIAMHGTNKPWLMGEYASNGCIRLENDVIQFLAENVPVGTRVSVVRD